MSTNAATSPGSAVRADDITSTATVTAVTDGAVWNALLDEHGIHDVYFRYGYVAASAVLDPGSVPVLVNIVAGTGRVLLPLLIRPIADEPALRDATTPYGYGGPVAIGDVAAADAASAFTAWAQANTLVTSFFRFHPQTRTEQTAFAGTDIIELGATVAWRVEQDREIEASMHKHHRRVVRKARKSGVEVGIEVGTIADSLAGFRAMYDLTMERQEAAHFYFFGDQYWQALIDDAGGDIVLATATAPIPLPDGEEPEDGVEPEREPIASLLCIASGDTVHYHLGASKDRARGIGASNLAFLETALWAQEHGYSYFHLGGGVGGGRDSLFDFKHRYDPESEPLPFHIGKLMHDPAAYEQLAGTTSTDGYFPAYRSAPQ